jgi:hypothetical protein
MIPLRVEGLPLERFGLYRIDVMLDNRVEESLNFRVVKVSAPGE